MESLLRWGIENSTPSDGTRPSNVQPRTDLDPGIIDAILGKSDAVLMKEDMDIALDKNISEDERVNALDHMEMLIEQIDNANNIQKLGMWPPLHSLLNDTSDEVKIQAIWVIGTALHNNPSAQASYLALHPLPTLTAFLEPTASTSQLRAKVIYTLSGLLKHNAPAVKLLGSEECDGWTKLRNALQDPDISVRRKTAFLLSTLLIPTSNHEPPSSSLAQPIHANSHASLLKNPEMTDTCSITLAAMQSYGIIKTVVDGLTNPVPYGEDGDCDVPDPDFEEKSVGIIRTYIVDCHGPLGDNEKKELRQWFADATKTAGKDGNPTVAERIGLSASEMTELTRGLA